MSCTSVDATIVKEVLAELESLGDENRRQYNAKAGPDGFVGAPPNKGLAASAHHQGPVRRQEGEAAREMNEEDRKGQVGCSCRLALHLIQDQ